METLGRKIILEIIENLIPEDNVVKKKSMHPRIHF